MVTLRCHNLVAFCYSNESTLTARSTGLKSRHNKEEDDCAGAYYHRSSCQKHGAQY
jgi:hypothetical protein